MINILAGTWADSEHPFHFLHRDKEYAYNKLKKISGQDFGYDAQAWREWFKSPEGRQHMRKPLKKSSLDLSKLLNYTRTREKMLLNLEGKFDKEYPIYQDKASALDKLKDLSGQDFGYDAQAWREWFNSPEGEKQMLASLNAENQE
ncbi:MAG: hypothetical protein AAFR81_24300 [Chloroflexota bacterium]